MSIKPLDSARDVPKVEAFSIKKKKPETDGIIAPSVPTTPMTGKKKSMTRINAIHPVRVSATDGPASALPSSGEQQQQQQQQTTASPQIRAPPPSPAVGLSPKTPPGVTQLAEAASPLISAPPPSPVDAVAQTMAAAASPQISAPPPSPSDAVIASVSPASPSVVVVVQPEAAAAAAAATKITPLALYKALQVALGTCSVEEAAEFAAAANVDKFAMLVDEAKLRGGTHKYAISFAVSHTIRAACGGTPEALNVIKEYKKDMAARVTAWLVNIDGKTGQSKPKKAEFEKIGAMVAGIGLKKTRKNASPLSVYDEFMKDQPASITTCEKLVEIVARACRNYTKLVTAIQTHLDHVTWDTPTGAPDIPVGIDAWRNPLTRPTYEMRRDGVLKKIFEITAKAGSETLELIDKNKIVDALSIPVFVRRPGKPFEWALAPQSRDPTSTDVGPYDGSVDHPILKRIRSQLGNNYYKHLCASERVVEADRANAIYCLVCAALDAPETFIDQVYIGKAANGTIARWFHAGTSSSHAAKIATAFKVGADPSATGAAGGILLCETLVAYGIARNAAAAAMDPVNAAPFYAALFVIDAIDASDGDQIKSIDSLEVETIKRFDSANMLYGANNPAASSIKKSTSHMSRIDSASPIALAAALAPGQDAPAAAATGAETAAAPVSPALDTSKTSLSRAKTIPLD